MGLGGLVLVSAIVGRPRQACLSLAAQSGSSSRRPSARGCSCCQSMSILKKREHNSSHTALTSYTTCLSCLAPWLQMRATRALRSLVVMALAWTAVDGRQLMEERGEWSLNCAAMEVGVKDKASNHAHTYTNAS